MGLWGIMKTVGEFMAWEVLFSGQLLGGNSCCFWGVRSAHTPCLQGARTCPVTGDISLKTLAEISITFYLQLQKQTQQLRTPQVSVDNKSTHVDNLTKTGKENSTILRQRKPAQTSRSILRRVVQAGNCWHSPGDLKLSRTWSVLHSVVVALNFQAFKPDPFKSKARGEKIPR